MITSQNINKANNLVSELHATESALRELKAGANVQSMTLSGGMQSQPSAVSTPMIFDGSPPNPGEGAYQPMPGAFVTLSNLEFPPRLLDALAEHLQHRLQRITSELHEMGIEYGA